VEGDGVSPILKFLADDGSKGEVKGVSIHKELFCPIGGSKYGVQAAQVLEGIEAGLFFIGPVSLSLFLC
jgi:hypothetical protein